MEKLAELDLPDQVYNWLADFFIGHSHCTVYCDHTSMLKTITASIIQGSANGPAAYVMTATSASDLKAVTRGNQLCKFADDTYLIIPAINVDSRTAEVENIEAWARTNNLTLNRSKTKKIIFVDKRRRLLVAPPQMADIIRVTSLKILRISITNDLSASGHVHDVIRSSAQILHALRVLRARGMNNTALQAIFRSTVVAKLCMQPVLGPVTSRCPTVSVWMRSSRRSKKCGYCPPDLPTFDEQCDSVDQKLFDNILANQYHLLSSLLPPPSIASHNYYLRPRPHSQELPQHTGHLTDSNFITRILYKNTY
jgi:Reverse transcriptase (RNA-dependent DNA polymerase)